MLLYFCMPEYCISLLEIQSRLAELDSVLKSAFSCSFKLLAILTSVLLEGLSSHSLAAYTMRANPSAFRYLLLSPTLVKHNNHRWNSCINLRSIICLSLVFSLMYSHGDQQDH